MNYDKKQLEILIMQYFKECYKEFPKGIVQPSESPDFTISLKSRNVLGIELTRLNPGNAAEPNAETLVKNENREKLIEMVRFLVEKELPHKLFVKFLFPEDRDLIPEKTIMMAVKTATIFRKAVKNRKPAGFFRISLSSGQLPDGINDVLIVNHPDMNESVWERANNLGISTDVLDDIRNSIHKKDEKLRIYQRQRLNYYWLLITTDRLRVVRNFSLAEKVKNHKFESRFQHVFLFDLMKADVFELV